MSQIVKSIDIDLPPQQVFDYIADANNSLNYMVNFTRFEPVGPISRGLGAKVEAEGCFMGMNMKSLLEIVEFEEGKKLVSRSQKGVKSVSIWEMRPNDKGGTEVFFSSEYSMPGSFLGKLLDKMLIEKDIEKMLVQTLVNLKKVLEGKPNLRAVAS